MLCAIPTPEAVEAGADATYSEEGEAAIKNTIPKQSPTEVATTEAIGRWLLMEMGL